MGLQTIEYHPWEDLIGRFVVVPFLVIADFVELATWHDRDTPSGLCSDG